MRRTIQILLIAIPLVIIAIIASAFLRKYLHTTKKKEKTPNVVIISIESFRHDHMGISGYHRPITPVLDDLAHRGTFFNRAYSQCSWTRPSVASTLTSSYQSVHRIDADAILKGKAQLKNAEKFLAIKINDSFQTLPELFQSRGYRCFGWTAKHLLWSGYNFNQGFHEYKEGFGSDVDILNHLAKLTQNKHLQPFLAFVHLGATHVPYEPEDKYNLYDKNPEGVNIAPDNVMKINRGEIKLTPEDIAHNIALYDGAIQMTDERIGEVLKAFKTSNIINNTIIVVMSDHGEEFYDHGRVVHALTVYEEVIRVPLIMAGPGIPKGKIIDWPVQNIDVMPTLSALIFKYVPEGLQGNNLIPLMNSDKLNWYPAYSERSNLHAVMEGQWKYIFNSFNEKEELYNLDIDPGEKDNLALNPEHKIIREMLAGKIQKFLRQNNQIVKRYGYLSYSEIPDDVVKKLRALGYLQ